MAKADYLQILREELVPALGCTEPIALAYGAAECRRILGMAPERIEARCSGNIVKNVKGVVVPNCGGLKGIEAAVVAGALYGDAGRGLEVLSSISDDDAAALPERIREIPVDVKLLETPAKLHFMITMEGGGHSASVEIVNRHTNISKAEKDGKVIAAGDDSSDEDSNYTQNQLDYFGSDEDESWSIDSESENNCEESDEEIPQEEIELDNINLQTYNEIYQMSIDDKLSQDVFNRIFHIGEKKLIETATILGIDSNLISTRLYEWIFTNAESNVQLANIFINDENTIWRRLHCYDEWSQFSEIALRFISIGCSESDVERSLSLQKEVLNMHTYNIGSDTLEARMRAQQEIHNQKNYI